MKTTVWEKRNIVMYIGGDPARGIPPEITIEIKEPQILFDSYSNTIHIVEGKYNPASVEINKKEGGN